MVKVSDRQKLSLIKIGRPDKGEFARTEERVQCDQYADVVLGFVVGSFCSVSSALSKQSCVRVLSTLYR